MSAISDDAFDDIDGNVENSPNQKSKTRKKYVNPIALHQSNRSQNFT